MKRRRFLIAAGGLLVAQAARAQQPARVYRIGFLGSATPTPDAKKLTTDNTLQALRGRGWQEGKNIVVVERWAGGKMDRLPQLAGELVQAKVDVIVAGVTDAAIAAKNATTSVPIVTVLVSDPVRHGLIASYARPGGNVTGLSYETGTAILDKHLELLKQAVPGLVRVAMLWNPDSAPQALWLKDVEPVVKTLKLELLPFGVRAEQELEAVFQRMKAQRAGALSVMPDPMLFNHRERITALAIRHRLPSASIMADFAPRGGMMGYLVDIPDTYRRAAAYVDKILRGAKPSDLPVEEPGTWQLTVNLKTARALGLKIPPDILVRADRVIE